jgi:hypothetical protein
MAECEARWYAEKSVLQADREFLSGWLDLLSRWKQFAPYMKDVAKHQHASRAARIGMMNDAPEVGLLALATVQQKAGGQDRSMSHRGQVKTGYRRSIFDAKVRISLKRPLALLCWQRQFRIGI